MKLKLKVSKLGQCRVLLSLVSCVEYVQRFATKDAVDGPDKNKEDEDEEMSDVGSISEEGH